MPARRASSSMRYSRFCVTPELYVVPRVTFLPPDPYPSVRSCSTLPLRQCSLAESGREGIGMAEHEHVRVAVVGSGFGGLGAAVRLRREGVTDFVVLERAGSVGGTWRDNSYPGCACDVPSHLYSFSFAPNPEWPRTFSGQEHIRAYLEHVADVFRLRSHLRFDTEGTKMSWDAAKQSWGIETSSGFLTADVVVSATGPLSDPKIPQIPGIDTFTGKVF